MWAGRRWWEGVRDGGEGTGGEEIREGEEEVEGVGRG
jgi:hypothetical protein